MSEPTHLNVTCPSRDHLIDYLLGRLPDDLVEPLEDHFADCDQCEDTLNGLSANDTFTQLAGSASSGQNGHGEDRAFVVRLVNQLQGDQRFHIQPRPVQERAAEVIRLLTPSESPASLGQLGDYRIERVLGAGSSGVVFYAIDESLDRPVALKVLRPSLGSLARQRFMIEARATASINSSQIVTIYQVGEENELAYIAMQWLPGETLESRLQRVTFLPQAEVQTIAGQILQGLQAAHQKMLVHRDIKPANIWLCEQDSEVKILDFGLARIADDDPQMTSTGILTGTPNFMSPEQARGQELSGRSDLFSLGCLMYQAATGILPFGEQRILATLQSIQHHHPRPPIELNPTLDNDFSDLVMCLLEKQPANRPASAEQAGNALNQPRADWGFPAGRYPAGSTDAVSNDRAEDESSTPIMPQHKSNAMRWIVSCVLVGLGIWGWTVFGQQIIRIATNQGEIVIESNDENINVEILKNGELIRVVDLKSEQAIEIKAGEYEIKAGSNGKDNTITVEPNRLALNRGGKQVVVISKRDSNLKSPTATAVNRREPTYDSRTFDQWMSQVQNEKSLEFINEAARAIGYLSRGDESKTKRALDWIRPLIREHGSIATGGSTGFGPKPTWPNAFISFFRQLAPELTVEFAMEEMVAGTSHSREQVFWNLVLGPIYDDTGRTHEHQKVVRDRLPEILNRGLRAIEDDRLQGETQQIRELMSGAIRTSLHSLQPIENPGQRDPTFKSVVKTLLVKRLAASHNAEARAFLASELVEMEEESSLAVQEFCELLDDPSIPQDLTSQMYFNHLALLSRDDFPSVIPTLINLFESNALCDHLANGRPKNGGGGLISATSSEQDRNFIRLDILERLRRHADQSSSALPWLDELASQTSQSEDDLAIARKATQVAAQIRRSETGAEWEDNQPPTAGGSDAENMSQPDDSTSRDSAPLETKLTDKTLHGKTLKEWIRILKTELDPKTVLQACKAIGELAEHDEAKSEAAIQSLIEWIEANKHFEVDLSARPGRIETVDVIISTAVKSLTKLLTEHDSLHEQAFESVTDVLRIAPVVRKGTRIGSSYQGNQLVQDAIGDAACKFFARRLKPQQAIEFIETHLVNGTEASGFRLRKLPSQKEFAATIRQELPALIESIETWPEIAKSESQRANAREFLRLGQYYFESDEFKEAAKTVMEKLSPDEEE